MGSYRTNKVWQSNRQPTESQNMWSDMLARQAKMIEARDRLATLYGPSEDHQAAWEAFWSTISDSATMREITEACEKQYADRRKELDFWARQEQIAVDAETREWELMSVYADRTAGIDEEIPF